ncbi:MAG: rhodanese-like domain-containing protein [Flavobacteriaceae bacterium]
MKYIKITLVIFILSLTFSGCKKSTHKNKVETQTIKISTKTIAKDVNVQDVEKLIKTNPNLVILDVRPPKDFKAGHIPNATYLDWAKQDEFIATLDSISKETPIVVYCNSGHRSGLAKKLLIDKKYQYIYDLTVGMDGWKKAALPVEK